MKFNPVERISILGAGVMGYGIAQVGAIAGFNMVVRDIAQELLDKAQIEIKKNMDRLVKRERIADELAITAMNRISMTLDLSEAIEEAALIIEAVPEKLDLKKKVWKEAASRAEKDAVLATNTSSLSITSIAKVIPNPERFLGMHFFNPPVIMRLVEVIPGARTSSETVKLVKGLVKKMGKTPIVVKKDTPGFIVNRILITYLNEAARLLDVGFTEEQIDSAMQYKAKMPLGPFMLADLIGIDIVYNILKVFEEQLGPLYSVAKSLEILFKSNKLGRKTGEGFYRYNKHTKIPEEAGKDFDIDILISSLIEEAEKVVKAGVANREVVDTAMKLGANLPFGPFEMMEKL